MIARADKSIASLSLRKVKARLVVEWLAKALGKRWVGRLSLLRSETFSIRKRTKARTVSQRKRLRSAGTTPRRRVKTLNTNTNTNIISIIILLLSLSFFLFLLGISSLAISLKIKKFQGCSSPFPRISQKESITFYAHTAHKFQCLLFNFHPALPLRRRFLWRNLRSFPWEPAFARKLSQRVSVSRLVFRMFFYYFSAIFRRFFVGERKDKQRERNIPPSQKGEIRSNHPSLCARFLSEKDRGTRIKRTEITREDILLLWFPRFYLCSAFARAEASAVSDCFFCSKISLLLSIVVGSVFCEREGKKKENKKQREKEEDNVLVFLMARRKEGRLEEDK